ncbi:hypothetical protein ACX80W_03485 [Arthrobacter sp. TMN-37]
MDPAGSAPRVFLAWLYGPLAVAAGLAAHGASGGEAPPGAVLLALTALLGLAASILARLRLPGWAVLLLCALTQQLLHLACSAFVGGSAGTASPHGHGGPAVVPPSAASAVPAQDLHLMLYAHAAAALLAALVIARGTWAVSWLRSGRRLRGRGRFVGSPPSPTPKKTGEAALRRRD